MIPGNWDEKISKFLVQEFLTSCNPRKRLMEYYQLVSKRRRCEWYDDWWLRPSSWSRRSATVKMLEEESRTFLPPSSSRRSINHYLSDDQDRDNHICVINGDKYISGSVLIRIITQSRFPHKFQVLNDFSRIQGLSKTLPFSQRSCGTSINHTTHRFSLSLAAELLYLHWDDTKVCTRPVVPGDLRCTCAVLFSLSLSDKCNRGDGFGKWINCDETRQLSFLGY